jgi:hypothetical protein
MVMMLTPPTPSHLFCKITAFKESTDFATLDTEKLFCKLKSHKLSCQGYPNHDASLVVKL